MKSVRFLRHKSYSDLQSLTSRNSRGKRTAEFKLKNTPVLDCIADGNMFAQNSPEEPNELENQRKKLNHVTEQIKSVPDDEPFEVTYWRWNMLAHAEMFRPKIEPNCKFDDRYVEILVLTFYNSFFLIN